MSRIPRTHIKTTFFHVMKQGINRNFIFDNQTDIRYYISIMNKLEEEHNISIIAYCIMNNHTHMLIEVENLKELSKYMQRLNTKYAKYYNKKYNRVGYELVDSDYVFPGKDGGKRSDYRRIARRVKEKAGLPDDFRPLHGLRHNFASRLASSGDVELYVLQKLLTHTSPQMTQRYAHLRDETLKKAASIADSMLQKK